MARCRGTTLKGERCKRDAQTGLGYCTIHEDQAPEGARSGSHAGTHDWDPRTWDADALLKTAVGFALVGAIVLFRIKR